MKRLINKSHQLQVPICCATQYEADEFKKEARKLKVDIPTPLFLHSAFPGTRILLSKNATQIIEDLYGVEVVK